MISNDKGVTTLTLTNTMCSRSGQYSVRLENKHGSEESKCRLVVVGMLASFFIEYNLNPWLAISFVSTRAGERVFSS